MLLKNSTALVGLLSDDDTDYRSDIDHFVSWCVANCLELNVVKTKEFVIDFRSYVHHPTPVNINGQNIEIVHSYKYLGTTIDDKLMWDDNTMNLYKKDQQRLYFLRKFNALHIDRKKHFICVPRVNCKKCYDVRFCLLVGKSLGQKQKNSTEYTPFLAKSLCAVHPIPVWSNCISQEHCKWQPKSYLTPPTFYFYTTLTNFSPLEGGTECQQ